MLLWMVTLCYSRNTRAHGNQYLTFVMILQCEKSVLLLKILRQFKSTTIVMSMGYYTYSRHLLQKLSGLAFTLWGVNLYNRCYMNSRRTYVLEMCRSCSRMMVDDDEPTCLLKMCGSWSKGLFVYSDAM